MGTEAPPLGHRGHTSPATTRSHFTPTGHSTQDTKAAAGAGGDVGNRDPHTLLSGATQHGRGGAPLGTRSSTHSHMSPQVPTCLRDTETWATSKAAPDRAGHAHTPTKSCVEDTGGRPRAGHQAALSTRSHARDTGCGPLCAPPAGDVPGRQVHGVSGSGLPGPGGRGCPWGWHLSGVTKGCGLRRRRWPFTFVNKLTTAEPHAQKGEFRGVSRTPR